MNHDMDEIEAAAQVVLSQAASPDRQAEKVVISTDDES